MTDELLTGPQFRRELLALLERAVPLGDAAPQYGVEPNEMPTTGIPTAALVVVEWQADDGLRWLTRIGTLGSGQAAPRWTIEMLAREALEWDSAA